MKCSALCFAILALLLVQLATARQLSSLDAKDDMLTHFKKFEPAVEKIEAKISGVREAKISGVREIVAELKDKNLAHMEEATPPPPPSLLDAHADSSDDDCRPSVVPAGVDCDALVRVLRPAARRR